MNEGSQRKLTPIHELSDLDLSFILSQLSSVSGEISEKTLEELLRDAESQPPSLSWCLPKTKLPSTVREKLDSEPEKSIVSAIASKPLSCTNVFKNAIDCLSEMSAMVKEKEKASKTPRLKVQKPVSNLKYKTNRATLLRKTVSQPKVNVISVDLARSNVKSFQPNRSTIKIKNGVKSNRTSVLLPLNEIKNNISSNKPIFKHNSKNELVKFPKKVERNTKVSVTVGDAGSSTCRISAGTFKEHEESCAENKTLQSNINSARSSNCQILSTSTSSRHNHLDISNCHSTTFRLNNCNPDLLNLEAQFDSLRFKYEEQFQRLNEKCERLEMFETEWKAKKNATTERTNKNIPTYRDFGAQVEIPNFKDSNLAQTEKNENISTKCLKKFPNINFDFDDLNLDSQFAPWQNTKNKQPIPKLIFNNKSKAIKNDKLCNLQMSSGEHRRLLSTVTNLQSEIDVLKKVNQRLKNQISSSNNRKSFRSRIPIVRTTSTQTSRAYSDCCNFDLSEDLTNRAVENNLLKDRIKGLEMEIKTLQENRQIGLTLLQRKHEEEIDNLLEQKMNLSKKLDAARVWHAFEGINGPGGF